MISFALEEEETLLVQTVRRVADHVLRKQLRTIEQGVPPAASKVVADLGLTGLCAAVDDGGQGARLVTQLVALEELAWGDAGSSLALCPSETYVALMARLANPDERERLLRPVVDGRVHGAVAYCRRSPDALVVEPTADGVELTGELPFVLHATTAQFLLVLTEDAAYVTEAGDGVTITATTSLLGLDAARPGHVTLQRAAATRLADPELAAKIPSSLLATTLLQSARQVGLARAAYELALEYTQDRKAFGKPVAHFQAIAFSLADMAMAVDSARWMVWRGADAIERHGAIDLAAAAIVQANEVAFQCADLAVQLLGGAGFIRDFPVEKWLRETKALALCGVPSTWAKEIIAAVELGTPIAPPSTWLQPFYL